MCVLSSDLVCVYRIIHACVCERDSATTPTQRSPVTTSTSPKPPSNSSDPPHHSSIPSSFSRPQPSQQPLSLIATIALSAEHLIHPTIHFLLVFLLSALTHSTICSHLRLSLLRALEGAHCHDVDLSIHTCDGRLWVLFCVAARAMECWTRRGR